MSLFPPQPLHGYQESSDESVVIVKDGTITYISVATPGTALSSATWKIMSYDSSTGRLLYADGNQRYDNVATTPSSLTYS